MITASATNDYCTPVPTNFQPDLGASLTLEELKTTLDVIENCPPVRAFIDGIVQERFYTRHGHPPHAMTRAWFAKYLISEPYNTGLVSRLRVSPYLREVCGFDERKGAPSESAFCRFFKKIAAAESMLQDAMPMLVEILHNQTDALPGLGLEVAFDGSDIEAHGNGKKPLDERADKTAEYGWRTTKNRSGNTGETERYYGYEIHAFSDTAYGVPLGFELMPANVDEKKMLPPVLERALGTHDWLKIDHFVSDRGYDATWIHEYLYEEQGITPVILQRKPPKRKNSKRSLYDSIYDYLGRPTCDGETPMEYVLTDPKSGKHLYRCPDGGCKLKSRSSGAMRYCVPTESHWEDPKDNIKVIGLIARDSDEFRERYSRRQVVERMFSSLKRSRILDKHMYLSFEKIYAHVAMSFISYVGTMVARVLSGQVSKIRHMRLQMPPASVQAA